MHHHRNELEHELHMVKLEFGNVNRLKRALRRVRQQMLQH